MQKIAVGAVGFLGGNRARDAALFEIVDHVGTALEGEVFRHAPRGDDFDVGFDGVSGQFETNLIVAFSGRAVADGLCALFENDIHHALGDQRAGNRGAEQIGTFVDGVGLHDREDIVLGELLFDVVDNAFHRAVFERLLFKTVEFLFLPDIRAVADHFGIIFFLQPGQEHRGVQPAGISQYNFHSLS